ncbi:MAG: phosphate/phosphite/phosphonate ABC transporter substrate-binding protein [Nitrospirae bacterium]|nr:phosphate/phosphite/phosphonate ABC transporter substrate-binding protein [Nitrospirota bacterium]
MGLKDISLKVKIIGLVVGCLLAGGLVTGIASISFIKSDAFTIATNYAETTVSLVTGHLEHMALSTGMPSAVKDFIDSHEGRFKGVESITVLTTEGKNIIDRERAVEDIALINKVKESGQKAIRTTKESIIFYNPLINSAACANCHKDRPERSVIGVARISISTKDAQSQLIYRVKVVLAGILLGLFVLTLILLLAFRIAIIEPMRKLESIVMNISEGDLSFRPNIQWSKDEIGRLTNKIGKALRDISRIIERTVAISNSIMKTTNEVERESKKVIAGSKTEAESINKLFQSIEELNKSASEMAEGSSRLIISSERAAVSSSKMAVNTEQIAQNTIELSNTIDSASSSVEEVSAKVKEIAQRAEELSMSATETMSAIEEIDSSVKEIESNTKESARLSEKVTSDAAAFGITSVEKTARGMERIKQTVQKTAASIEKLSRRSEEIGKILNVIEEITDQTTLLALNAAILAAQAGEQGKGFSVVADEIKDLAERTSMSTQEIADLIQSVQSDIKDANAAMSEGITTVEEGSQLTDEAKEALWKIVESSRQSTEMASVIERATYEQTKGVSLVRDAMERVRGMSVQIAAATSEQSKDVSMIIGATEKVREVAVYVRNETIEQSMGQKQLFESVENVASLLQEISGAINNQKTATDNILVSVERIKSLPDDNREIAFHINSDLRALLSNAEILMTELQRFKLLPESKGEVLKIGVIPLCSPAEMHKRFTPLAAYLSRRLDKTVELKLEADFAGTIKDIGEGVTDICYMTPSTFLKAREKYGVEVIAKALREGRPFHRSVIITKGDWKINSVTDIKGHSFAFGDVHSTSSHIVPRAMLKDSGVDINDLSFYGFMGHHDDVARVVLSGEFDAGGLMESVAERFKENGLKTIAYSSDIPEFNICVNKDMPEDEKALIKMALFNLNVDKPEDRDILQSIDRQYTGFTGSVFEDYKGVKAMMEKFKIGVNI